MNIVLKFNDFGIKELITLDSDKSAVRIIDCTTELADILMNAHTKGVISHDDYHLIEVVLMREGINLSQISDGRIFNLSLRDINKIITIETMQRIHG